MQETFLYSVNPRKVITGIEGVGPIRTPKSLYLTKEDVKLCLSKGTVYRRFSLEGRNERVTIANVDRLHNSIYISEEEWKTKQFEAPKAPVVVEDDASPESKKSNPTEDEVKNTESESVDVTEEVTEVEETSEDPVDKDEEDVVENEVSENEDTVDQEPFKNEDGEDSVESEDETEVESDDEEVENE